MSESDYERGVADERARIRTGVTGLFNLTSWSLLTREEAEAAVLAVIDGGES